MTGAGGGLGREHARYLAARGARVVVNDVGGEVDGTGGGSRPADSVVAEITAAGGEAVANYDSVATRSGGEALTRTTVEAFGTVDGLIHNAGILRDRSFSKLEADDLEAVLDVHLRGGFHAAQPAFQVMREQGRGRIVMTTSASGLFGNFGQTNYGAAKMGLVGLVNVLALEGAKHGVLVNAVAPSARTRMTEDLLGDLANRLSPELVSPLMAYLCSDRCELTHELFSAGGGRFARVFIGVNQGWHAGPDPVDIDDVEANLERIRDVSNHVVPQSGADEVALLLDSLRGEDG